ncbi:hypothetical protein Tco_0002652 [Tanacetum coccineum]
MVISSPCLTDIKNWLVQSKRLLLASPKQTALGKDFSNPLMVDSLPKTIWLSMHHVIAMKHWLFQSKRLLSSSSSKSRLKNSYVFGYILQVIKKLKLKKHEVSTASTSVSTGSRVSTVSRNMTTLFHSLKADGFSISGRCQRHYLPGSLRTTGKSMKRLRDLYKGLNIVTELLKELKNIVKDDSVINMKITEATESFTKFSINITDLQLFVNTLQDHALKQDEELATWAKSFTNMA